MSELTILLAGAAIAAFTHTLLGPDHYIPFIVLAKARGWTLRHTLFITILCGIGHVGSSIIIGVIGIVAGYGISHIEALESLRGNLAGWALFLFGVIYFAYGIYAAVKHQPHSHAHRHDDGQVHIHRHEHPTEEHRHSHGGRSRILTPWSLFIIFVLGPCEILIPLLMAPAVQHSPQGIVTVSLLFSAITIATMCAAVTAGFFGLKILPTRNIDRYMHAIAGATILLSGAAILFLGW